MKATGGRNDNIVINFPTPSPSKTRPGFRRPPSSVRPAPSRPLPVPLPPPRRQSSYKPSPIDQLSLEELLNLQLQSPQLKEQVYATVLKDDERRKEVEILHLYRTRPLLFWRDELGIPIHQWANDRPPLNWVPGDPIPLWSKQREIIEALVKYRKVAVKSGHGVGKSFVAAGLALYLAYAWHATGLTTAPCFDRETEILTDIGWKFFRDLDGTERVAQYHPDSGEMDFVEPLEYYKVPYKGKLLGVKNQLIDILTTPDHRFWVKLKETRGGEKNFEVKFAKDIYKKNSWRVQKSVNWKGKKSPYSEDWLEFLGFWFAEGNCCYSPERGCYSVGVTQAKLQNIDYVDDLFKRVGFQDKVKKTQRKGELCWDWNIYSKEFANQFKDLGKSKVRKIPRWILDLDKRYLEAFMKGYHIGDGTISDYSKETGKGGWWAISTASNQLADDILEICVKLGWVANKARYDYKGEAAKYGCCYTVSVWRRGHQAEINHKHWYEVDYDDYVYCVKVPTQLIMVRRNGKYHISGNTFRQVRRILWGEIHYLYNKSLTPLGGKLNQISLDLGDKWFIEGFATDKPTSNITGVHEENMFVIVDEAGGVKEEVFDALDSVLTSENSFVLYIGNPVVSDGRFFDAFKPGSGFHTITVNCYDSPNVRYQRSIYPKLTSHLWVSDKEKRWGKNSPLFKSRVEGEFPEENSDSLISLKYLNRALLKGEEETDRKKIVSYGVDVARKGTDSTVIGVRYASGLYEIRDIVERATTTEIVGRVKAIYREDNPKFKESNSFPILPRSGEKKEPEPDFPIINVDDIGVGGGVTDMLEEDGYPVRGVNVGESPDESLEDSELFLNKRAQYYWRLKVAFENEEIALTDEETAFELSKIEADYLRSGKIKIVDKDLIKKALNDRSPDRAESMMLAWATGAEDSGREWVRFL